MNTVNSILEKHIINPTLPRKVFYTESGRLFMLTSCNHGSPANRLYEYSYARNGMNLIRMSMPKFRGNVSLKNDMILCNDDEFIKQLDKHKALRELVG